MVILQELTIIIIRSTNHGSLSQNGSIWPADSLTFLLQFAAMVLDGIVGVMLVIPP